ncbi:choice-of-anchor D domain-containing protein [Tunturiibacter lichenicola]|uniref:choice-of-anchor D domain-containing protein n=1 Tax=Tunturiibacter lichenicola TaxID=2051959 RepID=UPI0021B29A70|nr:choice-of-anchor D domain-containing protein [Edaphobacter lichenicola]
MLNRALRPALTLLPLSLLIFGCGTQRNAPQVIIPPGVHGLVHGGQQPVTGATIQLYAVGSAAEGSPASPLLSPAPSTDATGSFNITGTYTCPSPSTLVYIVATGGNPGLPAGSNNAALSLMAALGPCGNLSASTYIFMNELTTIATVYPLAPYMTSPSAIGAPSGEVEALTAAFVQAAQLVNTTSGTAPGTGVPAGTTVPIEQINTIGNILSVCINSAGGTAGDNSPCGNLFSLTTPQGLTPATDTSTALLHIANDPALNTAALYNLIPPQAPFQPSQPQTPPDLSVRLTVTSGFTASPTELDFAPTRINSTQVSQVITFTNNTAAPVGIDVATLNSDSLPLSGANPGDFKPASFPPGSNPNLQQCSTPILPGASCGIAYTFAPTGLGPRSAYLALKNSSANPVTWILMTGTGLEANAGPAYLNPTSLAFTAAGTPLTSTLTNSGTLPLTIDSVTISNDPTSGQPAFTQTNNCGNSLAPQATCTITVTALATAQPYSTGTLTVSDDAAPQGSGPQVLSLTYSNGFTGSVLINFGNRSIGTQGLSYFSFNPGYPQGFTLTLTGPDAADFSFLPSSSSQTSSCTTERLNPFCNGSIYFTPSALGLRTVTLNVNGTPYAGIIGTGIPTGIHFSASPSTIDFGTVVLGQTSSSSVVTVSNTGSAPLTLKAPVLSGLTPSAFTIVSNNCSTLAINATCTFTLTASPAQPAYRFANLTLADSTGAAQGTVSLKVLGTYPPPVANPAALNFAYTPLGTISAPQSFTVTSYNNDPINVTVIDGPVQPFILTQGNSCSHTPCQISVAYAPTAANTAPDDGNNSYDEILVTDLFSGQAFTVNLSGIWQQPASPQLRR